VFRQKVLIADDDVRNVFAAFALGNGMHALRGER
jgi:hypothetical protein